MRAIAKSTILGLAILVLATWAAPAKATTLFTFVGDCSSIDCFGATYTLIVGDAGDGTAGAGATTYDARLIIDAAGYDGPISGDVFIDAADIGVVNTVTTYSLVDAPGGAGSWLSFFDDGQAANDCSTTAGGFFFCAKDDGVNTLANIDDSPLEWAWIFSSTDTITFRHIGASYNNDAGTVNGNNVSISSATGIPGTPAVPEPSTLILLGSGLIILVGVTRRNC